MKEFYYQIKGINNEGNWGWPPLHSGLILAEDNKIARSKLEEEYGMKLPGGRIRKGNIKQTMLLTIIDVADKPYLKKRFEKRTCEQCKCEYSLNEKYLVGENCSQNFCSSYCMQIFKSNEGIEYNVNFDFNGIHEAVIYKITNKKNGLCYVGKTTQAFTLRWYQHFYQASGTKFHLAIKEFGIGEWTFEILEIMEKPGKFEDLKLKMLERESYWIRQLDSIKNGYNSVMPKSEEVEESNNLLFNQ